jgi:hypothetical protein
MLRVQHLSAQCPVQMELTACQYSFLSSGYTKIGEKKERQQCNELRFLVTVGVVVVVNADGVRH